MVSIPRKLSRAEYQKRSLTRVLRADVVPMTMAMVAPETVIEMEQHRCQAISPDLH